MSQDNVHPFISYLQTLAQQQNRAALAALRRGLGRSPGTVPEMYPHIVPWIPENAHPREEAAYYIIAALFALHPECTDTGNMGDHMAQAAHQSGNPEAVERRFTALLAAHPDDLPEYLRQTVSFLHSKNVPINWDQLFADVKLWSHPQYGDVVRKRWATQFWRFRKS